MPVSFKPAFFIYTNLIRIYSLSFFVDFRFLFRWILRCNDGQGLASGTIAAVYAMGFAFVFVLLSIFLAYLLSRKTIIILNWILLFLLLIHIGMIINRFIERSQMEAVSETMATIPLLLDCRLPI